MDPRQRLDISWAQLAAALRDRPGDARAEIATAWPERAAVAFLSARTAFDALLQVLAIRPGDELVMSAVNADFMGDIARMHGLRVVPVDIELDTLAPSPRAVAEAVTDRTRLILIAHLFGARVDISAYAGIAPVGALLVEDCAHAWGGGYRGGAPADVSLFSFGPTKRRTALGGGVAAFADATLAAKCAALEATYEPLPETWFGVRAAKHAGIKLAGAPAVYAAVLHGLQLATGDADRIIGAAARDFSSGDFIERLRRRPPRLLLALLSRRLAEPENDALRIAAAREVLDGLDAAMALPGAAAPAHHYWLLPILANDPAGAVLDLRAKGFDATRSAVRLRAFETQQHRAPSARRLLDRVVYLPPPWRMSQSRRAELVRTVRSLAPIQPTRQLAPIA